MGNTLLNHQQQIKRTIIITDVHHGIGLNIVEKLLSESSSSYDIIMTTGAPKIGERVLSDLQEKYPIPASTLRYRQLDVNNKQSVRSFAAWIKATKRKFDILINNTEVSYPISNDEQKRQTIQTNFSSVVKFTEKLLPYLRRDGKVLMISNSLGQLSFQGATLQHILTDPTLDEKRLHQAADNIIELTRDYVPSGPPNEASYPASKALLNSYVKNFLPRKLKPNQQVYAVQVEPEMRNEEGEEGVDTPLYLINLPYKRYFEINAKLIGGRKVMVY